MSRAAVRRRPAVPDGDSSAVARPERARRGSSTGSRWARFTGSRTPALLALLVTLAALAALVCGTVPVGPGWLGEAGAVGVATVYSWALAARAGGRPVVFGVLAALVGTGVVIADDDHLRTGAAVVTCVVTAVLAVMATVPAVTFVRAVRECVVAFAVAAVGALAVVGLEPVVTVSRFEYASFGLALVGAFAVVHRLGAGLHGLGRRGVAIVVVGGVVLALTLAYAELLRRYGTPGLVESLQSGVHWSHDHLGASPRPLETVLGVPALAYGVHMRARRRQGWWVCAFGVAATSSVADALVNPRIPVHESVLAVVYGLLVGLVVALVVIRLDLVLTGSGRSRRSRGTRGRRSRVDEQADALRPEPPRTAALL